MIYDAARDRLSTKFQVNAYKTKKDRSAHLVIEIQAMIYDAAMVKRLCTKFQVNKSKNKNLHFGGALGGRGIALRSTSNLD